jgi:DNA-nicking Smr family endonuclease
MVSERIYDLCRPVLDNDELAEEDKVEKLEELLSVAPASLKGKALEDAVLGTLWQWKSNTETSTSPSAVRNIVVERTKSPAPWIQRASTPTSGTSSPRPSTATSTVPSAFGATALARTKSQTVAHSPFSSPKPSPRLPVATPAIPHSPRLSAYQFSDNSSPNTENYGDYGSDNVDWIVNDDASSQTSYGDSAFNSSSDFVSPFDIQMSPYDMLRSILQDNKTDDELDQLLMANGYDLSETINSLMDTNVMEQNALEQNAMEQNPMMAAVQNRTFLVGKDMSVASRPATPPGQQKSSTVCRYWLASGHCARADCRFAHEVQNHLCKYWLAGNCIAGTSCLFSHDPSLLMQQLSVAASGVNTPQQFAPNFQLQDFDSFPALQPTTSNPYEESQSLDANTLNTALLQQQQNFAQPTPGLFPNFVPTGPRHGSRPGSRHSQRSHNNRSSTPGSQPNFQDDEAFPTLGSAANKPGSKRHHGKRGGHGHHNQGQPVQQPGSLADVVRMSPSPSPMNARDAMRRGLKNNRSFTATRENSAAAMAIAAPKEIPWLETGDKVNLAYMKARQEAFKHGGLRNKFLQSAAQAWNRNDARGAKALSLRGQNENQLMREKHREAARALYEERNKTLAAGKELYVDLHGLHPEEAVQYLSDCLKEQTKRTQRPVYAICGTGHHSKNGKDKVGKAIRAFLNDWRYAFREFSVPGDRNNVGGILGIDPSSYDKDAPKKSPLGLSDGDRDSGVGLVDEGKRESTKVQLVSEDPRKISAASSALRRSEGSDEDAN